MSTNYETKEYLRGIHDLPGFPDVLVMIIHYGPTFSAPDWPRTYVPITWEEYRDNSDNLERRVVDQRGSWHTERLYEPPQRTLRLTQMQIADILIALHNEQENAKSQGFNDRVKYLQPLKDEIIGQAY